MAWLLQINNDIYMTIRNLNTNKIINAMNKINRIINAIKELLFFVWGLFFLLV